MTAFSDPIAWEDSLGIRPSSPAWRATIKALYGTPLDPAELELFRQLSGGRGPQAGGWHEFLAVVGRRGGKSETIARVAVFEALHGGHGRVLAPGQLALVGVVSPLREQSAEILGYVRGLSQLPQVRKQVARTTQDTVEFKTGVGVQVVSCDEVAGVSHTYVALVADEFARWPENDKEIIGQFRPALAPVVGAPPRRFLGITSAHIRDGQAYDTDAGYFGKPDAPVLVVRGSTETFNENIDRAWLARERRRVGETAFLNHYGDGDTPPQWVDALQDGFFEGFERCVVDGVESFPPDCGEWSYVAALDPAFKLDHFAMAIAHREVVTGQAPTTVLDFACSWRPPVSPEAVMAEIAAKLAEYDAKYRCFTDQHGSVLLAELGRRFGVYLSEEPWTPVTKPVRFGLVRGAMADGLVRLPDNRELRRELANIAARKLRSGHERIEARRGHDDMAHAAVLALALAMDQEPDFGTAAQAPLIEFGTERSERPGIHVFGARRRGVPPGATDVYVSGRGGVWYRDANGHRMWIAPD
ncbi:MAG: hypothetical protein IT384_23015 [Deltaproteobacteria bacterium]|nr:hypothetical protein [Deltaproteobacteria bacterium]